MPRECKPSKLRLLRAASWRIQTRVRVRHGGRRLRIAAGIGLAAIVALATAAPAVAHESRAIGRWRVEVGFGDEPPYAGYPNSVLLLLRDDHGKPVTDLGDSLRVEVLSGGQRVELPLEPDFEVGAGGEPGQYRAWFIPTTPGRYTFHFIGTISGDKVDQRFTSSPATFDDVLDPTAVQFPLKNPGAGQIAERLDREAGRLQAALAVSEKTARQAHDTAATAQLVAIIGFVFGGFGVALALIERRRGRG